MFSVEQRDALRERVLRMADSDERVVAGAVVGSLALGGGDRYSDLDLTFAVVDGVDVGEVLHAWTRALADDAGAVHLVDLDRSPTIYRVLLFPDALQLDLSMTPASSFRPAGPRFRLLFGETAHGEHVPSSATGIFLSSPPIAFDLFGWGVVYALHARSCIGRARLWQAEHYVGAVRDHALSLACLREGVAVAQARGYDDLSGATHERFARTHVGAIDPHVLRNALAATVTALIDEGSDAGLPHVPAVAERIAELTRR